MFCNFKMLSFAASCVVFAGNASIAGNLSLYSFTEGAADEGMPSLSSGDENVAIGDEAL